MTTQDDLTEEKDKFFISWKPIVHRAKEKHYYYCSFFLILFCCEPSVFVFKTTEREETFCAPSQELDERRVQEKFC